MTDDHSAHVTVGPDTPPLLPDHAIARGHSHPGQHRLVFVAGLHRSGTSILFKLLSRHPMVSGFRNTGVPEDEGQHLQGVYPPARDFGGGGRFGFRPEAHMTEVASSEAALKAEALFDQWSRYWDLDKPVLIEKSPPNLIRMRYLQSLFPQACFVVLTRHPVEVVLAQRKRSRMQPLHSLFHHWLTCHDLMEADLPSVETVCHVRYEEFLGAPQQTLDRVLRFMGVPPASEVSGDAVNPEASDRYRREWQKMTATLPWSPYTRLIIARFERRMNHFGYSLRDLADPGT